MVASYHGEDHAIMDAKTPVHDTQLSSRTWRPDRCDRIALVLQGGGALGAYQAGVYQALHEDNIEPEWVSGVSIGAINSAIIAGNSRHNRLDKLRTFWERITDRRIGSSPPTATPSARPAMRRAPGSRCRRASPASSSRASPAPGSP